MEGKNSFEDLLEWARKAAAPGLNFKDFQEGRTTKRTIIIEDDAGLRENIRNIFNDTGLVTFCAQDYKTAQILIYPRFPNIARFRYAIIDDMFPEERGKAPENLASKVIEELLKEHPGVRIFGYVENDQNVDRSRYVQVLRKADVSLDDLYNKVIADAETIEEKKDGK